MSRLLINEAPIILLPGLAVALGLNEAIFIQQLHYWVQGSKHNHEGYQWVYNTYADWKKQFPFWSIDTIKRTVRKLEQANLIFSTTKYNKMKIDNTKWYTINYDAVDALPGDTSANCTEVDSNLHPSESGQSAPANNQRLPETNHTREQPQEISAKGVEALDFAEPTPVVKRTQEERREGVAQALQAFNDREDRYFNSVSEDWATLSDLDIATGLTKFCTLFGIRAPTGGKIKSRWVNEMRELLLECDGSVVTLARVMQGIVSEFKKDNAFNVSSPRSILSSVGRIRGGGVQNLGTPAMMRDLTLESKG